MVMFVYEECFLQTTLARLNIKIEEGCVTKCNTVVLLLCLKWPGSCLITNAPFSLHPHPCYKMAVVVLKTLFYLFYCFLLQNKNVTIINIFALHVSEPFIYSSSTISTISGELLMLAVLFLLCRLNDSDSLGCRNL